MYVDGGKRVTRMEIKPLECWELTEHLFGSLREFNSTGS